MKYIVAVDNYKGFAVAAKKLFVTQPTLSMQIQKAENELGILIFDRSKQPVTPTEIGTKIIEQVRKVIAEEFRIKEIIETESGVLKGVFRLGVIPTIAPYLLPFFLETFVKNNSSIELVVEELQTDQIINGIRKDEIDAGILATPLNYMDITERPIYYEPFHGYVSKGHRLYKSDKINVADLKLNDVWLLQDGHCFRDQVIKICSSQEGKKRNEKVPLYFEGGSLETLMRLVENNFGMTLIPYLLARELKLTRKKKFIRNFTNPVPKREISIVFQRTFLKRQIILELEEIIINRLPKELSKTKGGLIIDIFN